MSLVFYIYLLFNFFESHFHNQSQLWGLLVTYMFLQWSELLSPLLLGGVLLNVPHITAVFSTLFCFDKIPCQCSILLI